MTRPAPRGIFPVVLSLMLAIAGRGLASELPKPAGPVLLTIAGEVGATNRGPSLPAVDAFLAYHEIGFPAAAEFDRAMLEGLGTHEVELSYKDWPKAYRFAGPRLADVLAAAGAAEGAAGGAITATALDGFAVEISAEDLAAHDWIVALEVDGRPLGIGQAGPLWLVYAVPGGAASEADEQRWPWAVFFIEVH